MPQDLLNILTETPKYAATALLYEEYINGRPALQTAQEAAVTKISAILDEQLEKDSVSDEIICDYEEAARCAGFYAGFKAAVAYLNYLSLLERQGRRQ